MRRLIYIPFRSLTFASLAIIPMGGVSAQTTRSGSESVITGINSLPGINPMDSKYWETNTDTTGYHNNDPEKTFFLYNVGANKFLNMGGAWGTHAALHTTPKYFFLFNNVPNENSQSPTKLNLRTKQSTTKSANYKDPQQSTDYMQYIVANTKLYNPVAGVYFDRSYNNITGGSGTVAKVPASNGWSFEEGRDYSADNMQYRMYQMVGGNKYYLVAQAADQYGSNVEAVADTTGTHDNKEWKLISIKQYYELFDQAPADLTQPTDASFLLKDPDFSVNNRYLSDWKISGVYRLGTAYYYKDNITAKDYTYTDKSDEKLNKGDYQLKYGRFFNAMIRSTPGEFYQGVTVTKPGWFIFRCRGISNTNAVLYAEQCTDNTYNTVVGKEYSSQALNAFPSTITSATDKMLKAGQEFAEGNYENEVMLYVTPQEGASNYYIRFGIKVGGSASAKAEVASAASASSTEAMTIFDTFRMLYAGTSDEPELILDEKNTDLTYLTGSVDVYTNTNLHLMRNFTLNKWNTIILPVNLTYGQMKTTFGDDVKLAYLWKLTDQTIRFLTVVPKSDDDVMLEANKPYIIYPTKSPGASQGYTATLHRKEQTSSTVAEAWEGNYQGKAVSDGKISIEKDHYQIAKVSLVKDNVNLANNSTPWVPESSSIATLSGKGTMTAYGTLAKTYSETSIIGRRNNCSDSYIMKDGKLYLVPSKKQYGLKAFRCWFYYEPESSAAKPTTMAFSIDGITDNTTSIEEVLDNHVATKATRSPGVYNLNGQRLRDGSDISGLPAGLYIVNGKKYVIK